MLLGMPTRLTARKRHGSEQVQNETPITLLVRMRLTCSLAHCLRQKLRFSCHARGERFIVEKEVHARCPSRGAMFRVRPAHIAGTRWNAALTAEYDSADSLYPRKYEGRPMNRLQGVIGTQFVRRAAAMWRWNAANEVNQSRLCAKERNIDAASTCAGWAPPVPTWVI